MNASPAPKEQRSNCDDARPGNIHFPHSCPCPPSPGGCHPFPAFLSIPTAASAAVALPFIRRQEDFAAFPSESAVLPLGVFEAGFKDTPDRKFSVYFLYLSETEHSGSTFSAGGKNMPQNAPDVIQRAELYPDVPPRSLPAKNPNDHDLHGRQERFEKK